MALLYSKFFCFSLLFCFFLRSTATNSSFVDYSPKHLTSLFDSWMSKHGKTYETMEEKLHRIEIFKENLNFIDQRNKEVHGYKLDLNKFSDLTDEEFKNKYFKGVNPKFLKRRLSSSREFVHKDVEDLPMPVDWREKGAVTPVKNQDAVSALIQILRGGWAFSVVAAVEGINQIFTGKLLNLSAQQLIDCDTTNAGCHGGGNNVALKYIKSTGGLHTEDDYPYKGELGSCMRRDTGLLVTIQDIIEVEFRNERSLLQALTKQPVSVVVDYSPELRHYSGGVYSGPCGVPFYHGMTAVGYGSDYIILKNLWGAEWVEGGYIKMKRNTGNGQGLCGITERAFFPIKNK